MSLAIGEFGPERKRDDAWLPTRYIGKYNEGELQAFPTADLRSLLRGA